jgi:hypothetical protein
MRQNGQAASRIVVEIFENLSAKVRKHSAQDNNTRTSPEEFSSAAAIHIGRDVLKCPGTAARFFRISSMMARRD